jgi:transcriptional regulator with XRE-family HTH domain
VRPTQISLPVEVSAAEIARKQSLGAAITLCYDAAGLEPKQVLAALKMDKAQLSRWESGAEGVCWPKLAAFMDACGNDAPVLWQLHQRGYDLASLRRQESELERRLRLAEEERDALKRLLLGGNPLGAAR